MAIIRYLPGRDKEAGTGESLSYFVLRGGCIVFGCHQIPPTQSLSFHRSIPSSCSGAKKNEEVFGDWTEQGSPQREAGKREGACHLCWQKSFITAYFRIEQIWAGFGGFVYLVGLVLWSGLLLVDHAGLTIVHLPLPLTRIVSPKDFPRVSEAAPQVKVLAP